MPVFPVNYVWLGGNNEFRYKTRTLFLDDTKNSKDRAVRCSEDTEDTEDTEDSRMITLDDIPIWNYDGSSTGQASSDGDTEITLKPVFLSKDVAICATYYSDGRPLPNNYYEYAQSIFSQKPEEEPWFGLEQEYFIMNPNTKMPVGMADHLTKQGQFYCGVGSQNSYGRPIAAQHYLLCLEHKLKISGMNQEVAVGQWEFQIGPAVGIEAAHHMMVARFLLESIAESYGTYISYEPKPFPNWNGSGCHLNFSTKNMRDPGGLEYILTAIQKLEATHAEHIASYGDNKLRLTGHHETSSIDKFTWGVGTRNTSIRIGNATNTDGCGYFEDRRPAADIDPYLVTALMFKTTTL